MSFNAGFVENPFGASSAAQAFQQGVTNGAPSYQSPLENEEELPQTISHYSGSENDEIVTEYKNPFATEIVPEEENPVSRLETAKNKVSAVWNKAKAGFKAFGQKVSSLFGRIKDSIADNKGKAAAIGLALMIAAGVMAFFPPLLIPAIALGAAGKVLLASVVIINLNEAKGIRV